jgi:hypothetical protein
MLEAGSKPNAAPQVGQERSGATLLLTATIRPGDVIFCDRRNVETRLSDYLFAFRFWLGESCVRRIVFVENSGFDLDPFRRLVGLPRGKAKQVELISFQQPPFDPNLGKSYGEARIIQYALENSEILRGESFVIKGTGRYYPTNFYKVWPSISSAGFPFVLANFYQFPVVADARYFGAHVDFLRDYFLPATREIDDSNGRYFEHSLAIAINSAVADGRVWRPFPGGGLLVDGVQASTNTVYGYPRWKRLVYRAIATLRNGVPFRVALGAPERRPDQGDAN